MAAKNRKTTATTKVKKKKWFSILAPAHFNNTLLGETYLHEGELAQGKYITANLSTLAKSMRKQNVNVQFRVHKVTEGKGETEIVGYWLINSAMKRLVRRGRDKVTDSFLAKTKDKKILRVKPLIITLNKGTRSAQTALRLETRRVVREFIFSKTLEEVFSAVIDGKLQKLIKSSITKISPVKAAEVKTVKLQENLNVVINEEGVITEEVKIRTKDKGESHAVKEEQPEKIGDDSQPEVPTQSDSEDFGEETTDSDDDLQDEEEALIEQGEEKADSTTQVEEEPETVLEEVQAEDAQEEAEKKASAKKE